jgi:Domain of unknown function (DUF4193)
MADDDVIDDEFEADLEEDLDVDADELDEEDLDVDVIVDDEDALVDEAFDVDADVPEVEVPDDVVDPDDVEADLEEILRDRIAAADDDDEEDEVEVVDPRAAETPDGVTPKKANEFVCTGCFLLVNRGQFGPSNNMVCPVGESDCPAITKLRKAKK